MSQINLELQSLARWLIACEASKLTEEEKPQAVVRVFDRLRLMLIPIVGTVGFSSLLSRVFRISAVKFPILTDARVSEEGMILLGDQQPVTLYNSAEASDAAEALLIEFFITLFSFIGTPLTLRLVRRVWANAPFKQRDTNTEGRS